MLRFRSPLTSALVWTLASLALLAAPAATRAATVHVATGGVDNATCGGPSTDPCMTLSYAVNTRAVPGDTVRVAAGVYPVGTGVVITKRLVLLGAQAGVDARTRTSGDPAAESVITGGPTFGLIYVQPAAQARRSMASRSRATPAPRTLRAPAF